MSVSTSDLTGDMPDGIEARLGYSFADRELLGTALTHTSLRDSCVPTNERLEFLGDAVIGFVISEHLFRKMPGFDEGILTGIKSVVVSAKTLASVAKGLGFEEFIKVGRGLTGMGGLSDSVLADAFEAVVAAVYLDSGIDRASGLVLRLLAPRIDAFLEEKIDRNFKSLLQNLAQRHFKATPKYSVVSEEGPDHGKMFEVVAKVGRRKFPTGRGRSKKEAEQNAAEHAYEILAERVSSKDGKANPAALQCESSREGKSQRPNHDAAEPQPKRCVESRRPAEVQASTFKTKAGQPPIDKAQ